MKRNTPLGLACGMALAALGFVATAFAATPTPNSAVVKTRIFNDCPASILTVTNNYPNSISIEDESLTCGGFANLHNWHFSEDGATSAEFENASNFRFSADLLIEGPGRVEAGLQISPWWALDVDGRFNVRVPDGEIACFGGRLPFYSFTASKGLNYVKGEPIHLEVRYNSHSLSMLRPATIEYLVTYQGTTYSSGPLGFDQGNPAEDPPHGLWGILNPANAGGYTQFFLNNANEGGAKVTFSNIDFGATPDPNSAVTKTRIWNDCPSSDVTVTNDYPDLVSIKDDHLSCGGYANLHNWHFSEDGANGAVFNNNSRFRFSADLTIWGTGNGEAGLQVSPWWSPDVDGRFNVRTTDGEIACFGGRLPFYSFTGSDGVRYTKGEPIHLEIMYFQHSQTELDPATIEYTLVYQGSSWSSGQLPFDKGNPAEDPPYGLWGMLNDGRAGGYLQAFMSAGNDVGIQADFRNIGFSQCLEKVGVLADLSPARVNLKSKGKYFTADLLVPFGSPYLASDFDISTIELNGVPVLKAMDPKERELRLKFDRAAVMATLPPGNKIPVFITGNIGSDCFEALEFVNVKTPKLKIDADDDDDFDDDLLMAGQTARLQWDVPVDAEATVVSLLSSWDGGATWQVEIARTANSGNLKWKVPDVATRQARLSVVTLGTSDETGFVNKYEFGETEDFTILSATGVGDAADVAFAIRGVMPNPARGPLNVSFSLPSRESATIAVYDVSGRQVALRDVGGLGAGRHTVTLGTRAGLRPGIYLVRLTQGALSASTRAVVIE